MKKYADSCSSSLECNQNVGLTCQSGSCVCQGSTVYNGTACSKSSSVCLLSGSGSHISDLSDTLKAHWLSCTQNSECDSQIGLVCLAQKCSCPTTMYFDGQTCCESKCSSLTDLIISDLYIFSRLFSNQALKLSNNQRCSASNACDESLGLSCLNGTCSCKSTQQFDNQKCIGKIA